MSLWSDRAAQWFEKNMMRVRGAYAYLFLAFMLLAAITIPYGREEFGSGDWYAAIFFFAIAMVFWCLWVRDGRK